MCGISAIFRFGQDAFTADAALEMTKLVAHRGPDGMGVNHFQYCGSGLRACGAGDEWSVALGHRRLSILDLSEAGKQPMSYRESLWITFNGEIYNFVELRAELEKLGHQFHSHTDTEVILAAYSEWGSACFERMRGMWGLVLLDGARGVAILSRDRLGIKPLHLARHGNSWLVASEIKQFRAIPGLALRPNVPAVWEYVLSGYEDCRGTFFEGIVPVESGHYLEIDLKSGKLGASHSFWKPDRVQPRVASRDEATQLFNASFRDAVKIHLRSDVPVGCALSGGLDSSTVTACIMALKAPQEPPLHTFSIVFPGFACDESRYINSVVSEFTLDSHAVTLTAETFAEDMDRFVWIHDEPVGSLSQYAAYAVARLTRQADVPVTLNGQGGDELFAGYWQSYFVYLRGLFQRRRMLSLAGHFAGALTPWGNFHMLGQVPKMFRRLRDRQQATERRGLGAAAEQGQQRIQERLDRVLSMADQERRVYEIRELHLPRLLKWDDRNFMAFSVEGRYPFLDHELIETVLSFEPQLLYARGWTKEPLRRSMTGVLPQEIVRRRTKCGFETPQTEWMTGVLKPRLKAFVSSDSPVWNYVGRDYVSKLAADVWEGKTSRPTVPQELFRLFLLDRWMNCFAI